MFYQVNRIKDDTSSGPLALLDQARDFTSNLPAGTGLFGIFQGLFGLASNELYLVTCQDRKDTALNLPFTVAESLLLEPTVRPTEHTPRQREGIYVFRWFRVNNHDVDEIAQLSDAAWQTFENSDYESEVQALFAEPDRSAQTGQMLLVTWYRDLNAWQASRQPPPGARENFKRRHALTLSAFPVATRLVSGDMAPIVPGGANRF